jgi:hypothetical protein
MTADRVFINLQVVEPAIRRGDLASARKASTISDRAL